MVSDPAASALTGRRLGVYHLQERIGAGGMGEVYRARDTKLGRDVAIKILPQAFTADPDRLARFEREARVLASLNHPNIGAIYGFEEGDLAGPAEAGHYVRGLVLELVDGETLAERIGRGPVPVPEAVAIAGQIAAALDAAHEKGIVHRDLKPANIKITPDGVVKVLDFGLAKAVARDGSTSNASEAPTLTIGGTQEGMILGTVAYMSPEQARGRDVDKRTDIWPFGCVLFEILTGRSAFRSETVSDTIAAILDREPEWRALPAATPATVRRLLERCAEKDPKRRLRDIGDARTELEAGAFTAARPLDVVVPGPATAPAGRGGAALPVRLLRGAVLIVVVAATSVAAFLAGRNAQPSLPTFRQVTFRHGSISGARLAPDGRTIIYAAKWTGTRPGLYVIGPDNPQSGSLGLDNAGILSISARGEMAVALECRLNWGECVGTLAQVPLTGGAPREIMKNVFAADWDPEGRMLAVVTFAGGTYRLEYPAGTVLYETPGWVTYARISPTGDAVAFLDHPTPGEISGSVSLVNASGEKTTLSSGWTSLQGLA